MHTKEPWRTTGLDRVIADTKEKVNDDYFIADCFGPDSKSNTRRIVACVNACSGIDTEAIEQEKLKSIYFAAKEAEITGFAKYTTNSGKIMVVASQEEIDAVIKKAIESKS